MRILAAKVLSVSKELALKHYAHLTKELFFNDLIRYITGDLHGENRVLAMVYYGEEAIGKVRQIAGATNPEKAEPVSIRGAYGRILTSGLYENVIHASSDSREAEREIKLWFEPEEIDAELYPTREKTYSAKKKVWA